LSRTKRQPALFPVASTVAGTAAIGVVIVGGSLLMAFIATNDRHDLIHSFALIGLGVLLLVVTLVWFYKANTSKAA
jgi:membrane protein DedA with SNARE-associated domain